MKSAIHVLAEEVLKHAQTRRRPNRR